MENTVPPILMFNNFKYFFTINNKDKFKNKIKIIMSAFKELLTARD